MKTEIENIIYNCADELEIGGQSESQIPHILIRVINAITLSDNKEELRSAINKIAEETELDKFFCLWLWRTPLLAQTTQTVQWRAEGTQITNC